MSNTKSGLPEHPEQTFTMMPGDTRALVTPDLPEPPTWTVTTTDDSTRTMAEEARTTGPTPGTPPAPTAYRLLRPIGEGAMGEVWEAEQTSLGRVIAVKRLRCKDDLHGTPDEVRQAEFRSESTIAASLEHPNILPVYDLGRDPDGALLLAMKRIHGTPWNEQLQAGFADTPTDAFLAQHIPVLVAVTQAVAFAHSRGIIHRDLKPAQVLVGAFGEVLLTDWGLAIHVDTPQGTSNQPTRAYAPTPDTATNPAGTPSMMAPEQTQTHGGNLGPWTDVYLLGGTLYYLLTGSYPHASDSSEAAFARARDGRVQPPGIRASGRQVPAELEQLCLQALEPDRHDRLPSAAAFLKALEDYQHGTARKEKSSELVAQVAQRFDQDEPDYAGYTAAIASLDEARRLWPDNPEAGPLRQKTLHGSARLALRQGDLGFARLQCEAMADDAQARTLRNDIARQQHQVDRRRSRLRLASAAVFTLLVVIAAGALVFSQRMQAANTSIAKQARETEQALQIAKARSADAFDLVSFVLKDLKQAMDEELTPEHGVTAKQRNVISSAIAGKVASPIVNYFENARPESWPPDMQLELTRQIKDVASHFRVMGRFEEAQILLEPALALRKTLPDPQAEDARQLLNELAVNYQNTGQYDKATPLLSQLIEIEMAHSGSDAPVVGELLINLGTLNWRMGDLEPAEKRLRRAVAIFRAHPEYELKDRLPHALNTLGAIVNADGRKDEAEKLLRQALRITEDNVGPDSIKLGSILNNLALNLQEQQKYAEADKLYRRAIEIVSAHLGPNHPAIGSLSLNVGNLLHDQHQDKAAEPWFRRSLDIRLAAMPDSPETADTMRGLAVLLADTGRYSEAEPMLRKSLAIYTSTFGPDHEKVGLTNYHLGILLGDTQRLREAQSALQDAVDVLRKTNVDGPVTSSAEAALGEINARLEHPG